MFRLGIATTLLEAVGDYVTLEKRKLLVERKCSFTSATLELDVDRSNPSAQSLYFKNGYLTRFSWGNLLNHRQKMYKMVKVESIAEDSIFSPVTSIGALKNPYLEVAI